MKLSHLLAGVAAAALTAGAANADITVTSNGANEFEPSIILAQELDIAAATTAGDLSGDLEFNIDLSGVATGGNGLFDGLAPTTDIEIDVIFTGLEFSTGLNASASAPSNAGGDPDPVIVSGGAEGESSVTFSIASGSPNNYDTDNDDLAFDIPLTVTDFDGNFEIVVRNVTSGEELYRDTYDADGNLADDQPLISSADGISVSATAINIFADAAAAGGVPFSLINGGNDIGSLTLAVDGDADINIDGTAIAADAAYYDIDLTVTMADKTSFTDVDVFGSVTADGAGNDVAFPAASQSVSFSDLLASRVDINAADLADGEVLTVELIEDAAGDFTQIVDQAVTYELTFDAQTGATVNSDSFSGVLGNIFLETSATEGPFDWTGGNGAATRSFFRCTGVPAAAQEVFATISNVRGGSAGTYSLGSLAPTDGELIVTNDSIGNAAGGYTRADVELSFTSGTPTCQRLLVGTNGTLSQLGDEND